MSFSSRTCTTWARSRLRRSRLPSSGTSSILSCAGGMSRAGTPSHPRTSSSRRIPRTRRGIPEATMKRAYPKTYKYLKQFETQLCKRASSSVRKLMESGPFYSMFAVGPYTIAPWKVLWPEVGHSIESAKCGPSHLNRGSKSSLPDHTVVAVSCDNEAEASYLSAILKFIGRTGRDTRLHRAAPVAARARARSDS